MRSIQQGVTELEATELAAIVGGDGQTFGYRVGQAIKGVVSFVTGVAIGAWTGTGCDD